MCSTRLGALLSCSGSILPKRRFVDERMPGYDLFLSYNRRDRAIVDPLAGALCERGLKVFKDDWFSASR